MKSMPSANSAVSGSNSNVTALHGGNTVIYGKIAMKIQVQSDTHIEHRQSITRISEDSDDYGRQVDLRGGHSELHTLDQTDSHIIVLTDDISLGTDSINWAVREVRSLGKPVELPCQHIPI